MRTETHNDFLGRLFQEAGRHGMGADLWKGPVLAEGAVDAGRARRALVTGPAFEEAGRTPLGPLCGVVAVSRMASPVIDVLLDVV